MIRKAKVSDTKRIYNLLTVWAKKGKLLNRSLSYIYEHIRDFWVYTEKNRILGCCALHIVGWENLAEIKSLAVDQKYQHKHIGSQLVKQCLNEANEMGLTNVFALTFVPAFFKKAGFKAISKNQLPHKIWNDCVNCAYFPNCNEEAVIMKIRNTNIEIRNKH